MSGLTTKRYREPRQRTEPLPEERRAGQPSGMCGWELVGKMHGLMWQAWGTGRG